MKKLNFEFIKKADYILVFLCAIVGLLFFLASITFIVVDSFSSSSHNQSVTIIESNDQNEELSDDSKEEESEVKETIEFNSMIKDVYVFTVSDPKKIIRMKRSRLSSYDEEDYAIRTNFLFISDHKEEYKLFPTNSQYIYDFDLNHNGEAHIKDSIPYNLYAVIKKDTNNDKQLNDDDDISFFISDYNGKNLMEISSSIMGIEAIKHNQILFSEFHDNELKYYAFDCIKREKKLIKSVKQEVKHKYVQFD